MIHSVGYAKFTWLAIAVAVVLGFFVMGPASLLWAFIVPIATLVGWHIEKAMGLPEDQKEKS